MNAGWVGIGGGRFAGVWLQVCQQAVTNGKSWAASMRAPSFPMPPCITARHSQRSAPPLPEAPSPPLGIVVPNPLYAVAACPRGRDRLE